MAITLEIPNLDILRPLPAGGRAWMYASTTHHHDALLELNCEPKEKDQHIVGAGIELRTRSGQWGYSLNTGNAISTIACQSEPEFPELAIDEILWRPAERKNGILRVQRTKSDKMILTIINAKKQCSVILSTQERDPNVHSIQLDDVMFRRFLALWGAMRADWENETGAEVAKFRWQTLEQALESDRQFFFWSTSV